MEASPDLLPISLKFPEKNTNNKLGVQTPTPLPNDIIIEIIERLPAISNFRFKCVSKQWFSLNFDALKLKSQTHTMSGIFYITYKGERATGAKYIKIEKDQNNDSCIDGTLGFLPEHRYMRMHDSCNGLLLCTLFLPTDNPNLTSCTYVCNPATRKSVEIPNISIEKVRLAILDFNPLVSVHFNVLIIMHNYRVSQKIKVFSSKSREWIVSQVPTNQLLNQRRFHVPVLFYKGLIFAIDYLGSTEMIGFDVKGKLCSRIDLPGRSLNDDLIFSGLCQLGGCLHYYCSHINGKVYIWKLESGSWLFKSCFLVPSHMGNIEDIKFHPIKDNVVFLKTRSYQLYSYDIKTTQMVELCSQVLPHDYCLYSPFYLDVLDNLWKING